VHTRGEIKKLHNRLNATMIYVTHDQVEAMTLGDRIAVMNDGIIQQCAPAINVYDNPSNMFVGGFIGSPSMNFIPGQVVQKGENFIFEAEKFGLDLPKDFKIQYSKVLNKKVYLGIRPTDIFDKTALPWLHLEKEQPVKVKVDFSEKLGMENYIYCHSGKDLIIARVDSHIDFAESQDCDLYFNLKKMHLFDRDTQQVII
jgi:multiple sugar transport system ATP-binding protein